MQNLVWREVAGAIRTCIVTEPARFAELLGPRCAIFFAVQACADYYYKLEYMHRSEKNFHATYNNFKFYQKSYFINL